MTKASSPPVEYNEKTSPEEVSQIPLKSGTPGIEVDPAVLEALLFVSPGPVAPAQLAAAMNVSQAEVESAIDQLDQSYADPANRRGLRLQRYRGRVQLITAPRTAAAVEHFLGLDAGSRLSRPALESLAIILYRQPVTRPQIDAVRGVNSDGVIKGLQLKGLVQEIGRAELPGRPILYSATPECLQYFGLTSLSELPPLNLEEPDSGTIQDKMEPDQPKIERL